MDSVEGRRVTAAFTETLPDIDGEACVHALSYFASCQSCVDGCPASALIMDDDMLGLDQVACTGCGLCQAACRQSAITFEQTPPSYQDEALLICKEVLPTNAISDQLQIACVHMLGFEQLATLYLNGVRRLVTSTADCSSCTNGARNHLTENLAMFNQLARSRDLPLINIIEAGPKIDPKWHSRNGDAGLENVERRALFVSLLKPVLKNTENDINSRSLEAFQKLGTSAKTELFMAVAEIDALMCVGCDACVNMCPQNSLNLVQVDGASSYYESLQAACTGCGLCKDVCPVDAVSISFLQDGTVSKVLLKEFACKTCGAPFHLPRVKVDEGDVCRICLQTNHHKNLFQVLT